MTTYTEEYTEPEVSHDQPAPATVGSLTESLARADAYRQEQARKAEREQAEDAPKIEAARGKAEEVAWKNARRRKERERQEQEEAEAEARAIASAQKWKNYARTLVVVSTLIALPLQVLAFLDISPWLVIAPFGLEFAAWVLLSGAEAAIDNGRPSWHYRLGALAVAGFAATINYRHGTELFDPVTGAAGAFFSLLGPAVWDLHEHGRIRKRDGKPTLARRFEQYKENRAKAKAEKKAEKTRQRKAEQEAKRDAERERQYAEYHPEVWDRAVQLRAARGMEKVSPQLWAEAWRDVHQLEVGETAETVAARESAKALAAEAGVPVPVDERARKNAGSVHVASTVERTSVPTALQTGLYLPATPDGFEFYPVDLTRKTARTSAPESGKTAGEPSRKENGGGVAHKPAQSAGAGARKSTSNAAARTARRVTTSRIGAKGRTRRTALTDEDLDEQVRALTPPSGKALSARFVAQQLGCDQGRAKKSLERTGRLGERG